MSKTFRVTWDLMVEAEDVSDAADVARELVLDKNVEPTRVHTLGELAPDAL
jgi:hypothetical protein